MSCPLFGVEKEDCTGGGIYAISESEGRLQSCTVLFSVDRHLDKLLAKWGPLLGLLSPF